MKFQCVKDKFREAVSKVEKITSNNPSLPVLSCVLIVAKGSNLTLTSTNLELGVEVKIPCKVVKEGVVAVPASILRGIVSALPGEGNIECRVEGSTLTLESEKNTSSLVTQDHNDFPPIPRPSGAHEFSCKTTDFVGGLKSVVYSTSPSSMRPEYSSVYMYKEGDTLTFVATDSFRLAETKKEIKKLPDFEPALLPFKNVVEITRLFDEDAKEVVVYVSKNQLSIQTDSIYVTSRVVEGSYPDYKQIIPKEFDTNTLLLKRDLEDALKMSTIFSDKFNKVRIVIDPKQSTIEVSSNNASIGESTTHLSGKTTGEGISVQFNQRYISDVISILKGESVELLLSQGKPMIMRSQNDNSFRYLVMPIAQN
jgi:DNA polymerase-3 subunit beta